MSSNSNTPVNRSINQYVFNEDIKVTFATQQITLSNKFLETVTTKIKQMKVQISQEQDAEKKQQLMVKCKNIENMLQSCLAEYKRKLADYKAAQQNTQNATTENKAPVSSNGDGSNDSNPSNAQNNQKQVGISLKTYLTEEQKVHYVNINTQFQNKSNQLAQAYEQNKKQLENVLERLKNVIPETEKEEYEELLQKKLKCEQAGKSFHHAYKSLEAQIQDIKKRFYIKASETNPTLKKAMMMLPQIQAANAQKSGNSNSNNQSNGSQAQPDLKSTPVTKVDSDPQIQTPTNTAKNASASKPSTQTKPVAKVNAALTSVQTQGILKPTISESTLLADAPKSVKPVEIPKTNYQKDPTQPTIFGGYLGSNPILSQPLNRVLGVNDDISATTQPPPTATHRKNVYIPTPQDHVLTKRKLRDLLKQYNGPSANIDGDVEELLLDLSDNFITQVVKLGGKVAKLRKSENLEVKDVKFALKKGFDLDL